MKKKKLINLNFDDLNDIVNDISNNNIVNLEIKVDEEETNIKKEKYETKEMKLRIEDIKEVSSILKELEKS